MEPEDFKDESGVTFEVVEGEIEGGKKVPRKGIYLLPNLFTTGALFGGFYGIIASTNGQFANAAIAILVAGILDGLDGRVARMTNTQSQFGAEYDSLSDSIAFGIAPALVIFNWSLFELGKVGWVAAFIYAACACLRLARFNVQAESADKSYFTGLSSPAAAGLIIGLVWFGADNQISGAGVAYLSLLITVMAGVLMVSNLRFPSFKQIDFKGRVPFITILVAVLLLAVFFVDPPKVLFGIALTYSLFGMLMSLWRRVRS